MFGNIKNCNNTDDFRNLAKSKLPSPVFHYIDGGADDEITLKRNRDSYETCDLVPNVLKGVEDIDISTTVMGQKIDILYNGFVLKNTINSIVWNANDFSSGEYFIQVKSDNDLETKKITLLK